jgi:phytoene synthase
VSAASEITRRAESNLAFALNILPRDQRQDMSIFYAFCRTIDDLADDPSLPFTQREKQLEVWKNGILSGFSAPDEFQAELLALRDRRQIPKELMMAIIEGCQMDLQPQRFQTWEDLSAYIWKVACAVGLVSIRLFGCQDPASSRYAIALGHALQLTNILRDIHEDFSNGARLYLPLDDLTRFGLTEQHLSNRVEDSRFLALMDFQAKRAEDFFTEAAEILPSIDRKALLPARIMGEIYQLLLAKMRRDRFQVFTKRYRISKPRKIIILSKHLIARS